MAHSSSTLPCLPIPFPCSARGKAWPSASCLPSRSYSSQTDVLHFSSRATPRHAALLCFALTHAPPEPACTARLRCYCLRRCRGAELASHAARAPCPAVPCRRAPQLRLALLAAAPARSTVGLPHHWRERRRHGRLHHGHRGQLISGHLPPRRAPPKVACGSLLLLPHLILAAGERARRISA